MGRHSCFGELVFRSYIPATVLLAPREMLGDWFILTLTVPSGSGSLNNAIHQPYLNPNDEIINRIVQSEPLPHDRARTTTPTVPNVIWTSAPPAACPHVRCGLAYLRLLGGLLLLFPRFT